MQNSPPFTKSRTLKSFEMIFTSLTNTSMSGESQMKITRLSPQATGPSVSSMTLKVFGN